MPACPAVCPAPRRMPSRAHAHACNEMFSTMIICRPVCPCRRLGVLLVRPQIPADAAGVSAARQLTWLRPLSAWGCLPALAACICQYSRSCGDQEEPAPWPLGAAACPFTSPDPLPPLPSRPLTTPQAAAACREGQEEGARRQAQIGQAQIGRRRRQEEGSRRRQEEERYQEGG